MSGIVSKNGGRGSGIVGTAAIGADAVDSANIADDAIDSEHYADGSIDNAHIADDAIDSEHYADGSIDNAHIADDAIDSEHYADGSIDNAHIADDAIDSEHYADGSIDEAHIADNAVTLAKMAGGTDGNIISFDGSGDPVAIATGNDGQVLTSTGAGSPPAFEDAAGGGEDGLTNSSNTTWMTVSADEEVNMPLQPVFAHTTQHTTDNENETGDGTLYTILFNTQKFDIGSNTDANGVFTAPITGVYLFGFHLEVVNGSDDKDYDYIYLDTGGFDPGSQHHFNYGVDGHFDHERIQMSFLVQMTAGWTAIPRISRYSGTKDTDIRGGSSHFWGALIA